ncbi:MAG TPA: hypothetical protein VGO61_04420 [Steroidobacteraceae bacterium]|nr:hypothetical protein [Steroidobacteraceae bacterium]
MLVQSAVYPDTYGTTSPLSPSWTDDSYFFSLVADSVLPEMQTRPFYWHFEPLFTKLLRTITPLRIDHPLDVLFFQSGTAALLATFSAKLMLQLSSDRRLANTVFVFAVICPFLMMNGGVIFLRDTLTAALFVYSLCLINERRFLSAIVVLVLQLSVRPGTGAILMFAYPIIYFSEIRDFVGRHPGTSFTLALALAFASAFAAPLALDLAATYLQIDTVGLLGRELFADLSADPSANAVFLTIQQFPFVLRLVLNAAYIFMYPFLTLRPLTEATHFDLRSLVLGVFVPIYSLWLNAWFFAGMLRGRPAIDRQRAISVAIAVILILVGTYSLQTRHKTIIYPLYYIMIAIGFSRATPNSRRIGYAISALFLLVQLASVLR